MDNGNPISIQINFAEFQSREEFQKLERINLGFLECVYNIDTNLSVIIFYKRTNEMEWEQTPAITLDKNKRRIFRKLPNGITCIDFYPQLSGSVNDTCEISLFRILTKPVILGKHN